MFLRSRLCRYGSSTGSYRPETELQSRSTDLVSSHSSQLEIQASAESKQTFGCPGTKCNFPWSSFPSVSPPQSEQGICCRYDNTAHSGFGH